ncbi:MAG: phenylalanine--tRNA ligase subunit beta [Hyphomicrobiales bacterium]|nr:MAG: phenylalanine--tRNA ligase subunit beta [Hyphomicrobiales bacterium]
MKFTLSWLKEHLETTASLDEIVETLTMIGLEVEEVENKADALKPFVVAHVISAEQHPNADRLRLCMVDTGSGDPVQVVCGAPNARTGMKGVFAPAGSFIPGTGMELKPGVIRGVESNGMLCSARELMLSDAHDGIIDLAEDAAVGTAYAAYAGLDDPVIEIAITPNRPDCLGVSGIARDLAAAGIGEVKQGRHPAIKGEFPCPVDVKLELGDEPNLCPAFALRLVKGVKNDPSPAWMQKQLRAIGLRPINALVDITNFMTYAYGRPLHVFDMAKVHGDIVVRRGRSGEKLLALDGKEYAIDEEMVVIADDRAVESMAGIMGGEESGCDENTVDVLIESALWDELNVAQTGRRLGLQSDARYRFERGIDPAFTVPGLDIATELVLELCGGKPSEMLVAGEIPTTDRIIEFPFAEVERLSGLNVEIREIKAILHRLGFWVSGSGDIVKVAPPSWRPDVFGKADLVEEVIRIAGLNRIAATPLPRGGHVTGRILTPSQSRTRRAKRALAMRGMVEAVTWSFIAKGEAEAFGGGQPELALANPISADLSDMRPSLIPGLATASQRNADRGFADVALFEVGHIYLGDQPDDQKTAAAGLRRGSAHIVGTGRHWTSAALPVDAFDAKADALAVLEAAGAPVAKLQVARNAPEWFHPGRSGTLQLGPQNVLAVFGELHPKVLETLDVDGPIVAFEVMLDKIPQAKAKATKTRPVLDTSDLMPVRRDFAFVVDEAVEAAAIIRAAQGAEKALVTEVSVFDVYRGKGIDEGKKSVALEVTLQPKEKTMTEAEIEAVAAKIVAQVGKATGGTLRG